MPIRDYKPNQTTIQYIKEQLEARGVTISSLIIASNPELWGNIISLASPFTKNVFRTSREFHETLNSLEGLISAYELIKNQPGESQANKDAIDLEIAKINGAITTWLNSQITTIENNAPTLAFEKVEEEA